MNPDNQRITMAVVAAALGVTKATVSMALKNDPRISAAMRKKVAAKAVELGYRPSPLVSALMQEIRTRKVSAKSGSVIALLIEGSPQDPRLELPSYRRILNGIRSQAIKQGFQVADFFTEDPDLPEERLDRILHFRGIRSVVLFDFFGDRGGDLPKLAWDRLAAVAFTHHRPGLHLNRVLMDHRQNAMLALEKLQGLGYRRIGLPYGEDLDPGFQYAISSAFMVWRHLHEKVKPIPFLPVQDAGITKSVFLNWVERNRPDALLTHRPTMIEWLSEAGYDIPGDIAVALTNLDEDPTAAGVDSRHEVVGAAAINILAGQLMRNEFGPQPDSRTVLVPGQWRDGRTVGPVAGRK